jgi:hypothetical protein
MKEAAKERGLNEMNADSIGRTPFNVAIPLGDLGPDEKRKIVRMLTGLSTSSAAPVLERLRITQSMPAARPKMIEAPLNVR